MTKSFSARTGPCVALALVLALSACARNSHDKDQTNLPARSTVYSPNGEPLTGGPLGRHLCVEALDSWFDRLDVGHTGRISHDQFIADTLVQFDRMNLDHDGFITSEELSRYRTPYEDTHGASQVPLPPRDDDTGPDGYRRKQQQQQRPDSAASRGGSRTIQMVADPVMSADTDLDFKVSRAEWLQQAEAFFKAFDHDHQGAFTKQSIEGGCFNGRWIGW